MNPDRGEPRSRYGVQGRTDPRLNLDGQTVGLPLRPFLYTLDQLATILNVQTKTLREDYIHFEGRSIGNPDRHVLVARNIAPPDQAPVWRVTERELVRWLKLKGFKYYDTGRVTS